jgi:hypothetical protein
MSHHFKVLRLAGVILQRAEGTSCMNILRRDDLTRFPGLLDAVVKADANPCGGFWIKISGRRKHMNLIGQTTTELEAHLKEHGEAAFRGRQISDWIS